jgi:hypothetical protein
MFLRFLPLIFVLIFCSACSRIPQTNQEPLFDSNRLEREDFHIELIHENFLGAGSLRIEFVTYNPKYRFRNEEEAWAFFIERYVEYVNNYIEKERLQQPLHSSPIPDKRTIEISFQFLDKKTDEPISRPFIGEIGNKRGKFYCAKWDQKGKFFTETFSEHKELQKYINLRTNQKLSHLDDYKMTPYIVHNTSGS